MSHDRGCACGKEPYEYANCTDLNCNKVPAKFPQYVRINPDKTVDIITYDELLRSTSGRFYELGDEVELVKTVKRKKRTLI